MFVQITAPPGATSSHVGQALEDVTQYLLKDEAQAVEGVFAVNGYSYGGHGQTAGLCFITMKPWEERPGKGNRVQQMAARINKHFAGPQQGFIVGFAPPAALEVGNATGRTTAPYHWVAWATRAAAH
jgi:multidrug efflux pump